MTFNLNLLSGKKTYLLAIAAIVYALAGFVTGNVAGDEAIRIIWEALTAAAIRAGVSKM